MRILIRNTNTAVDMYPIQSEEGAPIMGFTVDVSSGDQRCGVYYEDDKYTVDIEGENHEFTGEDIDTDGGIRVYSYPT